MNNGKIKCSIGILTLNCEDTLARCLENLRDFDEIIVCDGNSTDKTIGIAKNSAQKLSSNMIPTSRICVA